MYFMEILWLYYYIIIYTENIKLLDERRRLEVNRYAHTNNEFN